MVWHLSVLEQKFCFYYNTGTLLSLGKMNISSGASRSQSNSDWNKMRSILFQDEKTAERIFRGLQEINSDGFLVGDCHPLIMGEKGPKRLALIIPREGALPPSFADSCFKALRLHTSRNGNKEVFFQSLDLTLNVHVLHDDDVVEIRHLQRLFKEDRLRKPSISILRCTPGSRIVDLDFTCIGGLCGGLPRSIRNLKHVASLKLSLGDGREFWQELHAPKCPPLCGRMKDKMEGGRAVSFGPVGFRRKGLARIKSVLDF